jgi:hypothetical protein
MIFAMGANNRCDILDWWVEPPEMKLREPDTFTIEIFGMKVQFIVVDSSHMGAKQPLGSSE